MSVGHSSNILGAADSCAKAGLTERTPIHIRSDPSISLDQQRGYSTTSCPRSTLRDSAEQLSPSVHVSPDSVSRSPFELDNWQILQDLIIDEGERSGAGMEQDGFGRRIRSAVDKQKSLSGIVLSPRSCRAAAQRGEILSDVGGRHDSVVHDCDGEAILSSSPPIIDGLLEEEGSHQSGTGSNAQDGRGVVKEPPRTPSRNGKSPIHKPLDSLAGQPGMANVEIQIRFG
jgi:hypothetical protein